MILEPQEVTKQTDPMPLENITFPSASRIGCWSGSSLVNADQQPVIELEVPESQIHKSVMGEEPMRKAVATPADSSKA